MSDQIDFESLSFVAASEHRRTVLKALANGPRRPKDIELDIERQMASISRALGELRDEGLVELLVSEEVHKGRYYGITEEGERVLDDLDSVYADDPDQ